MYYICGVTKTGEEYLYDLFLRAVTFVAGFSMHEQAKLAPESGARLGKSSALPQQTGQVIGNLNEPGHIAWLISNPLFLSHKSANDLVAHAGSCFNSST